MVNQRDFEDLLEVTSKLFAALNYHSGFDLRYPSSQFVHDAGEQLQKIRDRVKENNALVTPRASNPVKE